MLGLWLCLSQLIFRGPTQPVDSKGCKFSRFDCSYTTAPQKTPWRPNQATLLGAAARPGAGAAWLRLRTTARHQPQPSTQALPETRSQNASWQSGPEAQPHRQLLPPLQKRHSRCKDAFMVIRSEAFYVWLRRCRQGRSRLIQYRPWHAPADEVMSRGEFGVESRAKVGAGGVLLKNAHPTVRATSCSSR